MLRAKSARPEVAAEAEGSGSSGDAGGHLKGLGSPSIGLRPGLSKAPAILTTRSLLHADFWDLVLQFSMVFSV